MAQCGEGHLSRALREQRMELNKLFHLNQKLKGITRVVLTDFVLKHQPKIIDLIGLHKLIVLCYFYKAVDVFDGIIQLQKQDLLEDAQALIRVLFETNLKFCYFVKSAHQDPDKTVRQVYDSIYIMREKDALNQGAKDDSFFYNANEVKKRYSMDEIKQIRKNGFIKVTIEELAKQGNKISWYQYMYRNFSRNVHANDLVEYFYKVGIHIYNEEYEGENLRNEVAIMHAHECFFEIAVNANNILKLNIESTLQEIRLEFEDMIKND